MILNRLTGAILLASSVLSTAPLLVACTGEDAVVAPPVDDNPLAAGDDFVAIPRDTDAATQAKRAAKLGRALPPVGENKDFYLAIKKSALAERYFLSAFLEQYYPGAVTAGAARTLGTKVIAFREQNGKLFVFDASEGKAADPIFDPTVLVEAYPIIKDKLFGLLPGAHDYVLIDPAAGLNRFNVVSDTFAAAGSWQQVKFEVELSFLQRFRQLADGVAYQQVFAGYSDIPDPDGVQDPTVSNTFQGSGTLNVSLRKYKDTPGFEPATLQDKGNYFFAGKTRHRTDGETENLVNRWNIHPGMQPIEWVISAELPKYLAAHPELAGTDVLGAVERGIEGWNDVFGYEVFRARIGTAADSPGDDDKNFILFDPGQGPGYAYANWRSNPITGEIRGAIVYMGSAWLNLGFDDDQESAPDTARPPRAKVPAIGWEGVSQEPHCNLHVDDARRALHDEDSQLTAGEKNTRVLQWLMTHEIGHNLGLRHNFKGSLVPPTSSVMDYNDYAASFEQHSPAAYDVEAIGWLYGFADGAPSLPFCTDEDTWFDPDCVRYDGGADPLHDWHLPTQQIIYSLALDQGYFNPLFVPYYLNYVASYVLGGTPEQASQAWEALFAPLRAPVDPAVLAERPLYATGLELLTVPVLRMIFESQVSGELYLTADASPVYDTIVNDIGNLLLNPDGVRTYETRRFAIDRLAEVQRLDAYNYLLAARQQLVTGIQDGTLTGADQLLSLDLVQRIDSVTSPYFQ